MDSLEPHKESLEGICPERASRVSSTEAGQWDWIPYLPDATDDSGGDKRGGEGGERSMQPGGGRGQAPYVCGGSDLS